jgi:hypothetical protein
MKPDLYFMEWCMTLFCKRLKLGRSLRRFLPLHSLPDSSYIYVIDVVGRVWDCYLISGEAIVYRCAVGRTTTLLLIFFVTLSFI